MRFYDIFQSLCKQKGVTPTAVGRALGVKQQTISHWNTRGSLPNTQTLNQIADYFGVPVEMLFDYNDRAIQNMVNRLSQIGVQIDLSTIEGKPPAAETALIWAEGFPDEKIRVKLSDINHALCAAETDAFVARSVRLRQELNLPPPEYVSTNIGGIEMNPALAASVNIFQP